MNYLKAYSDLDQLVHSFLRQLSYQQDITFEQMTTEIEELREGREAIEDALYLAPPYTFPDKEKSRSGAATPKATKN